jgi:hypothetical protein
MELTRTSVAQAMAEAIAEVLENTAFMDVLPGLPEDDAARNEAVYYTRLPIYKPAPSTVGLVIPLSLALNLANAMLMKECDPDEDEFQVMDVLSELTNMLAGSLLTHLLADLDSFELGLPECHVITNPANNQEWEDCQVYTFQADGVGFSCLWLGT